MIEFIYNNTKNISTNYISFKFNYSYHPYVFFENKTNSYLKSYLTNKPAKKLGDLILIC